MSDIAALALSPAERARCLAIEAELMREAARALPGLAELAPADQCELVLALALIRIARTEPRGLMRRKPAQRVVLDATRMAPGIG